MSCNEIINLSNISKTYKCFDNKIDIIKTYCLKRTTIQNILRLKI